MDRLNRTPLGLSGSGQTNAPDAEILIIVHADLILETQQPSNSRDSSRTTVPNKAWRLSSGDLAEDFHIFFHPIAPLDLETCMGFSCVCILVHSRSAKSKPSPELNFRYLYCNEPAFARQDIGFPRGVIHRHTPSNAMVLMFHWNTFPRVEVRSQRTPKSSRSFCLLTLQLLVDSEYPMQRDQNNELAYHVSSSARPPYSGAFSDWRR